MTARRVFWLLLLLAIVGAYHYRRLGLDVLNFGYKFGQLYFNKERLAELDVHGTLVRVYAEPVNSQPLRFIGFDQLQPTLKKAYNDYFTVIENHYPEIFEEHSKTVQAYPKKEILTIIFVSPDTYQSLSKIRGQDSSGHVGFLNTIYLKTYGKNYQVKPMAPTIRHEIFHYLNNYFGITAGFEEAAAQRFGGMK